MLRADNWLLGRWVPLITGLGLKHLKDFLCKANRSTLHYVLASFVLFHSIRHLKVLQVRLLATYVCIECVC